MSKHKLVQEDVNSIYHLSEKEVDDINSKIIKIIPELIKGKKCLLMEREK